MSIDKSQLHNPETCCLQPATDTRRCGLLVRSHTTLTSAITLAFAMIFVWVLRADAQTLPTCLVPAGPNGAFLYDNNGTSCLAARNVVYASAF